MKALPEEIALIMFVIFCLTMLFVLFRNWFAQVDNAKTKNKNISRIVKEEIQEAIDWELKFQRVLPKEPEAPFGHYPEWHSQGMIDGLNRALTILKRHE